MGAQQDELRCLQTARAGSGAVIWEAKHASDAGGVQAREEGVTGRHYRSRAAGWLQ
jgi:hypothetical protein